MGAVPAKVTLCLEQSGAESSGKIILSNSDLGTTSSSNRRPTETTMNEDAIPMTRSPSTQAQYYQQLATRTYERSPWPLQTHFEGYESSSDYGRGVGRRNLQPARRQGIADQNEVADAMVQCQLYSGNDVISCFPTTDTVVFQHEYASFVWNSRRPELTQINLVDIYLFRADSGRQIFQITNQTNPFGRAGLIRQPVSDSWFGEDGFNWDGQNKSYPFYWVIVRSDTGLDGRQMSQPVFSAVQTTLPDSFVTSHPPAANPSASVQSDSARSDSPHFSHWGVIAVCLAGFLVIIGLGVLSFFISRHLLHKRRQDDHLKRNSMSSSAPLMANVSRQDSRHVPDTSLSILHSSSEKPNEKPASPGSIPAESTIINERERNTPGLLLHDGTTMISAAVRDSGLSMGAGVLGQMPRKPGLVGHLEEGGDSIINGNASYNRHPGGTDLIDREFAGGAGYMRGSHSKQAGKSGWIDNLENNEIREESESEAREAREIERKGHQRGELEKTLREKEAEYARQRRELEKLKKEREELEKERNDLEELLRDAEAKFETERSQRLKEKLEVVGQRLMNLQEVDRLEEMLEALDKRAAEERNMLIRQLTELEKELEGYKKRMEMDDSNIAVLQNQLWDSAGREIREREEQKREWEELRKEIEEVEKHGRGKEHEEGEEQEHRDGTEELEDLERKLKETREQRVKERKMKQDMEAKEREKWLKENDERWEQLLNQAKARELAEREGRVRAEKERDDALNQLARERVKGGVKEEPQRRGTS